MALLERTQLDDVLDALATSGSLVHLERLPARPARFSDPTTPLPSRVRERLPIDAFWSHQAAAIDLVRSGRNVAIATGTASGATHLSITTQPSSTAQSGAVFAAQPVIQLRDANGNAVSQAGVSVTVTASGGTLGGTASATTNASGVATFSGLSISGLVGSYTLTFQSTGLASVTSGNIALSAGAAATSFASWNRRSLPASECEASPSTR